ncbi:nuclear transport factor 2 family protein [Mycobacterium sp. TY815]|uniref:nuclear transport factor 2 family protein n=1 Tax=Mycobacterium sp. TY815 TaxID=3050581 RepID=UPI00274039D2|nr:nuclear transport factor 2 family protein [Mycobacterium sp. TY815]MDP7702091.1 nuclear transport factor 2 family protein [Mycobacterium sp. TY815]
MDVWELVAREQIRDTLARYNWSGDAGRLDDLAAAFCEDGLLEIRGLPPLRGRAEIAGFLRGVTGNAAAAAGADRRPLVRHILTNVLFTDVTADRAHVSSYFTVVTHVGLDHVGRYRDVLVPAEGTWLITQRTVSTDWAAPTSQLAHR